MLMKVPRPVELQAGVVIVVNNVVFVLMAIIVEIIRSEKHFDERKKTPKLKYLSGQ